MLIIPKNTPPPTPKLARILQSTRSPREMKPKSAYKNSFLKVISFDFDSFSIISPSKLLSYIISYEKQNEKFIHHFYRNLDKFCKIKKCQTALLLLCVLFMHLFLFLLFLLYTLKLHHDKQITFQHLLFPILHQC